MLVVTLWNHRLENTSKHVAHHSYKEEADEWHCSNHPKENSLEWDSCLDVKTYVTILLQLVQRQLYYLLLGHNSQYPNSRQTSHMQTARVLLGNGPSSRYVFDPRSDDSDSTDIYINRRRFWLGPKDERAKVPINAPCDLSCVCHLICIPYRLI